MTVRQYFLKKLWELRIGYANSSKIMDEVEKSPRAAEMQGQWRDSVTDYPTVIMDRLWFAVKLTAIKWLEEHDPKNEALSSLKKS